MTSASSDRTTDIALTVTCKPKYYKLRPEEQLDKLAEELIQRLRSINAQFTAVAEFTKQYNIHFHCILTMPLCKYPSKELHNLFRSATYCGFIYVKIVDNDEKWIGYMFKEVISTYNQLNCRHPVIVNDYDIEYDLGLQPKE